MILTSEEIHIIATSGSLAPSGGNIQPWKLVISSDHMDVFLDSSRCDSFLDADRSASLFGLGCFVENVTIALDWLGIVNQIHIFNHNVDTQPIVTIDLLKKTASKRKASLYSCIALRHTNRRLFDGRRIPDHTIKSLTRSMHTHYPSVRISCVHMQSDKEKIATALGFADGIRIAHDELFKEMIEEFRWTEEEVKKRDGLEFSTLELPGTVRQQFELLKKYPILRQIIPERSFRNLAKPLLLHSSHLVCLSIAKPVTYEKIVRTGQAMERLWLCATKLGISIQPWSVAVFYLYRLSLLQGVGFSSKQRYTISHLDRTLKRIFQIPNQEFLSFIFRLSYSPAPTTTSKKRDWHMFTTIKS